MRSTVFSLALGLVIATTVLLAGCGGNASPAPTATASPAPTPTTPAPTPTPTPPPSGGGTGGGTPAPSVSPTTYTAGLLSFASGGSIDSPPKHMGTLTINNGTVTYKITGWVANATATVGFCAYPVMSPMSECFDLNQSVTTDSSGAASGSFKFPKSGTTSGTFHFNLPGTNPPNLDSGFTPTFTGGLEYAAAIVKYPDINATLGTGSVTVSNGVVQIQVSGARPNTTYGVWESFSTNGEDQIGTLITDGSGNGSVSVPAAHGRGLIVLRSPSGSDVSSGFTAP